ncbi:glycosyltransferase family 2 protein [Alicyclobacillus cycloheptanicus]|uniref:Glycosyl transferase family 2 n=1 Tax=Alicyclobacillus cycloheptanicus TaxID=1457 RepID=A0ABT9XIZ4_9BACL|nr:glycosyltransferase family 2 protein [Alicyclobacillus cycloheptanicus]MDQ0190172.1 hypothetical protein [Alicyclobacillus cycloheptanicus]WDM02574.1 glycosyltransferase family 2 protein [Alicyclobacillus cycloheptanicus]
METCAIIPARNEAEALPTVLRQVYRSGVRTCVVVANGCSDDTARVAKEVGTPLFTAFLLVEVADPLGPDVPRALGAYHALRRLKELSALLFVDGDWRGGFGPQLAHFLTNAASQRTWVQGIGGAPVRIDQRLWYHALRKTAPQIADFQPARLPLWVDCRLFQFISPGWLHHPGRFTAYALRAIGGQGFGVDRSFDGRLVGNPARDETHAKKMAETLLGDALEGTAILLGTRPSRAWQGAIMDGYHSARRIDVLERWQSVLSIQDLV